MNILFLYISRARAREGETVEKLEKKEFLET